MVITLCLVITTSEYHGNCKTPLKRWNRADPHNLQVLSRTGKVSSHLKEWINMTDTNKRSQLTWNMNKPALLSRWPWKIRNQMEEIITCSWAQCLQAKKLTSVKALLIRQISKLLTEVSPSLVTDFIKIRITVWKKYRHLSHLMVKILDQFLRSSRLNRSTTTKEGSCKALFLVNSSHPDQEAKTGGVLKTRVMRNWTTLRDRRYSWLFSTRKWGLWLQLIITRRNKWREAHSDLTNVRLKCCNICKVRLVMEKWWKLVKWWLPSRENADSTTIWQKLSKTVKLRWVKPWSAATSTLESSQSRKRGMTATPC